MNEQMRKRLFDYACVTTATLVLSSLLPTVAPAVLLGGATPILIYIVAEAIGQQTG